jgi:hypothetical protein
LEFAAIVGIGRWNEQSDQLTDMPARSAKISRSY